MKTITYPVNLPADLYGDIRRTAKQTSLSMADAIRQSLRLGLPVLREKLAAEHVKPFSKAECRQSWEVPNEEFDALEHHCARLPQPAPEE
ncbi:MAG TPA: hypothetical protein VJA21_34075 [Verrucomicrobiae bacterium]